jgi:hypothetical protein
VVSVIGWLLDGDPAIRWQVLSRWNTLRALRVLTWWDGTG